MKFLGSQMAYFTTRGEMRSNLRALLRFVAFLVGMVTVYAVLFHLIMVYVEKQEHSWITGFYWTLTVMTTLGFGDITFATDLGRLFSIVVLLSGVVFLLVVLPFLFIRLFYAPWLESQVRLMAPREVPPGTSGHVIIACDDPIARGLSSRLQAEGVSCFILEADATRAIQLMDDGVMVVVGDNDARLTYERLRTGRARLVLANGTDAANTNITLTLREVAPEVPVVALVEEEDSVDILQLSGANTVLPLKKQLGEYLANRVHAGCAETHAIGSIGDLQLAELAARDTPLVGASVRDTRLRERTGLSVIGLWQRGALLPAWPDSVIQDDTVVVLAGSEAQLAAFSATLPCLDETSRHVLLVGAGKVGRAAARALKRRGLKVHALDRQRDMLEVLAGEGIEVFHGDAADRRALDRAGLDRAGSVLLTTNDDATNIYLSVYCRRLNPKVRIVSRVTHERNVEAIHRAGADFVLSYTTLGIEGVMTLLRGHEPVILGEGVELFSIPVPDGLAGRLLRDSGIGSRTGMTVVALRCGEEILAPLAADTVLPPEASLLMLGSLQQRQSFAEVFD